MMRPSICSDPIMVGKTLLLERSVSVCGLVPETLSLTCSPVQKPTLALCIIKQISVCIIGSHIYISVLRIVNPAALALGIQIVPST